MNNLSFQYPSWYLIFCIFLGLAIALLLYFRGKAFAEQSNRLNWILGGLRFLTISGIAILLLSPLMKSIISETKKPIVVVAQDISESVVLGMSENELEKYQSDFKQLVSNLETDYEVETYTFGSEVVSQMPTDYTAKSSNIAGMLTNVYDLYSNQNLGAVVLASDGIYNEGVNPIYAGAKMDAPIYTVALGDTTVKKDLLVKRVFNNRIAYLDDRFTIQVDVSAINSSGEASSLTVAQVEGGQTKVVKRVPIKINKNDFFKTVEIILDAKKVGVQRYQIKLSTLSDETNTVNNTRDIFIDVLDARQKILLLANAPHPDISAIKQRIANNKNYEVSTAFAKDANLNIAQYDFVVLHQLPSSKHNIQNILTTLKTKRIPHLFVVGNQSNLTAFNQAQSVLDIRGNAQQENLVQAKVASNFVAYTLDEKIVKALPKFVPLKAPFGDFKAAENAEVLLYQRIGKVDTKYPLLVYGEDNGIKIGVLAAEGIWKWKLFDYLEHENHEIFDEWLGKMFQYLSVKEDKRKFRVDITKNIYNENEAIYFDAELYNASYERINTPDVAMVLTNEEGKNYDFTFSKTNNAYVLNTGFLPVGNYKYTARVAVNGEELKHSGQFSVQPVQLEVYETTADHGVLRLLSDKYGGELVYPNQLDQLVDKIKNNNIIKPVVYQTTKTRPVIHLKWLALVLLLLLAIEWFLRRYYGSY